VTVGKPGCLKDLARRRSKKALNLKRSHVRLPCRHALTSSRWMASNWLYDLKYVDFQVSGATTTTSSSPTADLEIKKSDLLAMVCAAWVEADAHTRTRGLADGEAPACLLGEAGTGNFCAQVAVVAVGLHHMQQPTQLGQDLSFMQQAASATHHL